MVIAAEGYPEGMARTVFAVRDPSFPLAEENVVEIDSPPPDAAGRRVLSVATLVPADLADAGPQALLAMRSRVLETLRWIVPFLDRHLLVVDSPHDGAPVDDRRPTAAAGATTGGQTGPSLSTEERWRRTPKAMEPVWGPLADSVLGVTGLSTRLGIKNLLSAGSQVVPGLGVEGLFLAGWTAARIITRTDRKKERMRRELWAKMEI